MTDRLIVRGGYRLKYQRFPTLGLYLKFIQDSLLFRVQNLHLFGLYMYTGLIYTGSTVYQVVLWFVYMYLLLKWIIHHWHQELPWYI